MGRVVFAETVNKKREDGEQEQKDESDGEDMDEDIDAENDTHGM